MKLATAANYQDHGYITAEYDNNNKIGSATAIVNNEAYSFGMEVSKKYTLHNIGDVSVTLSRPYQSGDYFLMGNRTITPDATDPDFVLVQNLLMPITGTNRTIDDPPEYMRIVVSGQTRYVVFTDFPDTETINLKFVSAETPE